MSTKLFLAFWIGIHFVLQSSGLQRVINLRSVCDGEKKSTLAAISEFDENSSAFQKITDNHNRNYLFHSTKPNTQLSDRSYDASSPRTVKEGFFPQRLDTNSFVPKAPIYEGDQSANLYERSPLSLAHLSHEGTKYPQRWHSPDFYSAKDFTPLDCFSFLSNNNLAAVYPKTFSAEEKETTFQTNQPSSSMDLYEVNNNNIESNNSYFWDPQLQFPYPKQDNVDMSQFGQLKEKNPTRSMQTNLSDHWKIELNYNEDDQELLEEMLNSQNDQNLLEEMLNSHDDMEVVKFQLPSSSHRPDSQTESHSPVALKSSRGSILKTLIHDEKIDYSKITANKKRKMPNISPKEKHRLIKSKSRKRILKQERKGLLTVLMNNFTIKPEKEEQHYQVFNAIDQKPPWVYKITDDDSELKRSIDIKIRRFLEEADCEENTPNFRGGVSSSSRAYDPVPNAVSKGIQRRAFEYTKRISWEGCETFKKELDNLLRDWKHSKELNCQEGAFSRIEDISTVGANIMKIISKLYAEHPRSKEFGENKKILTYTNDIWKICFPKRENKAEDLAKFCKSLGAESERAREKCLSIKFNNQYSGLNQIFLAMRSRITLITEKIRILQYAWYFALLRASVFFPEEILIHNTSKVKRNTRNFMSNGILYFAQIAGEKPKRRERLCTS